MMAFGLRDRESLITAVEAARLRVCGYSMGEKDVRCDCKFGATIPTRGENTGCPELRVVVSLLKHMTDLEFEGLCARLTR